MGIPFAGLNIDELERVPFFRESLDFIHSVCAVENDRVELVEKWSSHSLGLVGVYRWY